MLDMALKVVAVDKDVIYISTAEVMAAVLLNSSVDTAHEAARALFEAKSET
jgi:hypothetical protein